MQTDKNNPAAHRPGKSPAAKKHHAVVPLSIEEIEYLKAKRFIEEWDVMRFFGFSRSTLYNRIRTGELQYSLLGGKKIFDLQAIFEQLEKLKGK